MTYALGPVKPWVQDVADRLGPVLKPTAIGGWRATNSADMSGHPAGLALDWSVGADQSKGDVIAGYFMAHAADLQVKYVIWQQRIWYPGKAWTPMETRTGAGDVNHRRHVHVSFNPAVADGRRLPDAAAPIPERDGDGGIVSNVRDMLAAPARVGAAVVDGLGTVAGAVGDAASALNPLNGLKGIELIAATLTDRRTWTRVLQIGAGAGLIIFGVQTLVREAAMPLVGAAVGAMPQGRVAKVAVGAATAAGNAKSAAKSAVKAATSSTS